MSKELIKLQRDLKKFWKENELPFLVQKLKEIAKKELEV